MLPRLGAVSEGRLRMRPEGSPRGGVVVEEIQRAEAERQCDLKGGGMMVG